MTVLTAVMIGGVLVIIGLLVTTLRTAPPALPETLALPAGAVAEAVTQAQDWIGVVTTDGRLFIFDRSTGALRQEIRVTTGANTGPGTGTN